MPGKQRGQSGMEGSSQGRRQVGNPYATDRELVEEGQEREGTNLDIGEERSEEQKRIARQARQSRESEGRSSRG